MKFEKIGFAGKTGMQLAGCKLMGVIENKVHGCQIPPACNDKVIGRPDLDNGVQLVCVDVAGRPVGGTHPPVNIPCQVFADYDQGGVDLPAVVNALNLLDAYLTKIHNVENRMG